MKTYIWLLLFISNYAISASFNCEQDLNRVERMICYDKELSTLDDTLGALYKYKYTNEAEKEEQIDWIKNRNKCKDNNCIQDLYEDRIKIFSEYRLPIKTCITSPSKLSEFSSKVEGYFFSLDREVDLNGDGQNELIYRSGGCNAHCEYIVYELKNGCIKEIASFTAREYFIKSNCLMINNYEPLVDGDTGPKDTPWCFGKK